MTPYRLIAPKGLTLPAEQAPDITMHQTEGRPQVVQDSFTLSKSDDGLNLSSHIPANQIPPVSGPMVPASGQNPARMFHPNHPGFLHVGHRRSDRTVVWLSTPPRPPTFQQVFRDQYLAKASERELDFDWLDEVKVERFPGPSAARKEKARRLHLNDIICANRDIATPDQSHALKDQTSLAEDTSDDGSDGHGSIDETEMTSELLTGTRLVVSTNDRSNFASFYVYASLEEHWTMSDLFESLIKDCRNNGQAVETASTIEAKCLWDGRAQLLRKDKPEDWTIFRETLLTAWEEKRSYFMENGCEVEMVLCVEEGP